MAAKKKSHKTGTANRGSKKEPIAGSPVTIGGGLAKKGKKKPREPAYIEFDFEHWNYNAGKKRWEFALGNGNFFDIELQHHSTSTPTTPVPADVKVVKIIFN